jgi:hypothetical protein
MEHADVSAAFDMVLVKIQEALDDLNHNIITSSQAEEFDVVQKLAEKGKKMLLLREQVLNAQIEWNSTFIKPAPPTPPIPPDTLTSELQAEPNFADDLDATEESEDLDIPAKQKEDFYVPILGALVELGGRASSDDVLNQVAQAMAFSPRDLKTRPAGAPVRWMHMAHQARHDLVHEKGFLAANSPRGIWEITEAGRKYMTRNHLQEQ